MFFFSCWNVEYAESPWPCVCVCEWVVSRIRIWLYNMQEILKRKGFLVSPNLSTLGKPVFYYKTLKMPFFPFLTATEEAVAYLYIYTHFKNIYVLNRGGGLELHLSSLWRGKHWDFWFFICWGGAWGSNKEEIRWGSELQQGWNSVLFLSSNQNTETFLELCKFIGFNFPSKWYFEHFNLMSAVELLFGPSSAFWGVIIWSKFAF